MLILESKMLRKELSTQWYGDAQAARFSAPDAIVARAGARREMSIPGGRTRAGRGSREEHAGPRARLVEQGVRHRLLSRQSAWREDLPLSIAGVNVAVPGRWIIA